MTDIQGFGPKIITIKAWQGERAGKLGMSKALPAGRSWPSLPDLDLIASQTRLIIRNSRKFTATGFLQSLLSSVATGLASLNQIAGDLKDRDHPGMARQSLHERFDIRSTAFLMAVLGDLMQQRYSTAATAIGSCGIQRAARICFLREVFETAIGSDQRAGKWGLSVSGQSAATVRRSISSIHRRVCFL